MAKIHQPGAGNVTITLTKEDGEELELVLKPTLQAGLTISRQSGGIRGAIDKVMAMDLDTITMVIRTGVGPAEAKRLKNLDAMLWANGLTDAQGEVLAKCVEFLSNLARGGRPASDDDEDESEGDPTMKGLRSAQS